MGGGNFGKARIEVDADFSKAEAKLNKFGQSFAKTSSGLFAPSKVAAEQAIKAVEAVSAAERKLAAQRRGAAQEEKVQADLALQRAKARQAVLAQRKAQEPFRIPEKGIQEIARLTGLLNKAERAFAGAGRGSQSLANHIEELRQRINAIRSAHADNILPISKIQLAAKEIGVLRQRLGELEKAKFLPGSKQGADASREITKVKDAIERLGGASDRNLNFIQRHSAAINSLAFAAARAGHGFANFLPLITRVTTLMATNEFGGGGLRGALDSLRDRFNTAAASGGAFSSVLAKLGSMSPGVVVGIAAAAAAITALGAAVVFAALKLGPLGAQIQAFRDRLQVGFGEGADIIQRFASTSVEQFGLTELAAIKLTGTIGNVFQSFDISKENAAEFSVALADAAFVIHRTTFTTDTYEEVLTKLKGALTGNVEALREYGIAVNEATIRDTAAAHGVKLRKGELDAASKALLAEIFIIDQAIKKEDELAKGSESVLTEQQKLSASFEELKTSIGEGLVPVFGALIDIGQGVVDFIGLLFRAVSDVVGPVADLVSGMSDLLNIGEIVEVLFGTESEKAFEKFAHGIGAVKEEIGSLEAILPLKDFREEVNSLFEDFTKGKLTAEEFFNALAKGLDISPAEAQRQYRAFFNAVVKERPELEKYRDSLFGVSLAQQKLIKELRKLHDGMELTLQDLHQLRDAHVALQRAIEDAARAEADALLDLQRAREDAVRKAEDAIRKLVEAEEDQEQAIFDARRKRHDVQIKNFRSVRDAEEKLKEARVEGAKKVDDAEKALFDARMERFNNILNAQISLEEALFKGDVFAERSARLALINARALKAVEEAKLKLDEEREERAKKIKEAQRDLDEERFDAQRRLADANRDLARTIDEQAEAMAEARRAVHEAEIEINRSLFDANKNLLNTQRESAESIKDAKDNLYDLNVELGTTNLTFGEILDKIERMQNGLLVAARNAREIWKGAEGKGKGFRGAGASGNWADGGFQPKGSVGWVGERGPELRISPSNATIISNEQVATVLRQMQGGKSGSSSTNIQVFEAIDGQATAAAVINRMVLEGLA